MQKLEKCADPCVFHAKPEKLDELKRYCKDNHIDLLFVAENIPESKCKDFDKFLIEHGILEEIFPIDIAVPTKNKALLQELKDFTVKNNLELEICGNCARISNISAELHVSQEFENLSIRLETDFNKEMEENYEK